MKQAPSNYSSRNTTKNQNTGNFYEYEQEQRQKAIESAKLFDKLPHLKNKPIKYDLK